MHQFFSANKKNNIIKVPRILVWSKWRKQPFVVIYTLFSAWEHSLMRLNPRLAPVRIQLKNRNKLIKKNKALSINIEHRRAKRMP